MDGGNRERGAEVSVIIPVRNDPRVSDCVRSIVALRDEVAALQVIVVDHSSSEEFGRDVLACLPGAVSVLRFEGATVYGARAAGVAEATGEVLLFTDADCVVRPGWLAEPLRAFRRGADLVQGHSGSLGRSRSDALIQRRYEAHLSRLRPGEGTECDTRNLAVHRRVFGEVGFPVDWRRTGDTYLGLMAEAAGFRVAYWPAMRVDHRHDTDLAMFVAKQICHGWGAQRIMREHPEAQWHGGHLRFVARIARSSARLPGQHRMAGVLGGTMVRGGGLLDRLKPVLPAPIAGVMLLILDKGAALAGHLLFEAGGEEPRLSDIVGRADVVG
ncbi:MAG: glycosyltransferase [Dehalococcoidia bacterium]